MLKLHIDFHGGDAKSRR